MTQNNLCFTESFIQPIDAEDYFYDSLNKIDLRIYDITEATLTMINEKSVVRILAVKRQGELFG